MSSPRKLDLRPIKNKYQRKTNIISNSEKAQKNRVAKRRKANKIAKKSRKRR